MNIEQRLRNSFLAKLKRGTEEECWNFPYVNSNGYGQVAVNETIATGQYKLHHRYAHRLAYEVFNGPIPGGLNVCHRCDNPRCVNPAHLFVGTDADNNRDKVNKDRQTRGESNGNSILTEDVVRRLRSGELKPSRQLARKLGLADVSHLYLVRDGKHWKHVA